MKFSDLQESDRNKYIEEGSPILLSCELSHDPSVHVDWYKDGMKLLLQNNMEMQSDGLTRTLLIHSAESTHGGTYECATSDDAVTFKVEIKGDHYFQNLFIIHTTSMLVYGLSGKQNELCLNVHENMARLAGQFVLSIEERIHLLRI